MHFDRNPFTCSCEAGGKKALMVSNWALLLDFFFGVSDGAASMAVKGLNATDHGGNVKFSASQSKARFAENCNCFRRHAGRDKLAF